MKLVILLYLISKTPVLTLAGSAFYQIWYAPIIYNSMHSLLISENEFFHEVKCNGMTSFMDFMWCIKAWNGSGVVTSKAIACTRDGLLLPRTKSPVICLRPGRPIMATGRQPLCQVLHSFPLVHPSRLLIIANVLSSSWAADPAVPILHKIPKQCSSEALFVQYVVGATK